MVDENVSLASEVKVTYAEDEEEQPAADVDLEAATTTSASSSNGAGLRPFLEQAGTSFRKVRDVSAAKTRALGAATVETTRSLGLGTQLAAAATLAHTQHTLAQIGSNPLETNADGQVVVKGEENDGWVTGLHANMIQLVAIAGGLAALVSMVLFQGHLIDISSLATIILAPLVFWQKMELDKLGGMVCCVCLCGRLVWFGLVCVDLAWVP